MKILYPLLFPSGQTDFATGLDDLEPLAQAFKSKFHGDPAVILRNLQRQALDLLENPAREKYHSDIQAIAEEARRLEIAADDYKWLACQMFTLGRMVERANLAEILEDAAPSLAGHVARVSTTHDKTRKKLLVLAEWYEGLSAAEKKYANHKLAKNYSHQINAHMKRKGFRGWADDDPKTLERVIKSMRQLLSERRSQSVEKLGIHSESPDIQPESPDNQTE